MVLKCWKMLEFSSPCDCVGTCWFGVHVCERIKWMGKLGTCPWQGCNTLELWRAIWNFLGLTWKTILTAGPILPPKKMAKSTRERNHRKLVSNSQTASWTIILHDTVCKNWQHRRCDCWFLMFLRSDHTYSRLLGSCTCAG